MAASIESIKRAKAKYRANPINRAKENAYNREWYQRNKERKRITSRLSKYRLTKEAYNELLAAQNGLCAICKSIPERKIRLSSIDGFVIDHCHTTSKVRGLLCESCNRMLGAAKDRVETLANAISYLEENTGADLR